MKIVNETTFRSKPLVNITDDMIRVVIDMTGEMNGESLESCRRKRISEWQPIETAPRDGTYIILAGPSGYTTTPLRCAVGHYDPEYRPLNPWQTYSNDAFTDGGEPATHWMPLPRLPGGEINETQT